MPIYDVYVHCDQCGQPHPVNLKLTLEDSGLNQANVGEFFQGKDLPSGLAFMQTNKYRCPHTKQLFPADDLGKAIFYIKDS